MVIKKKNRKISTKRVLSKDHPALESLSGSGGWQKGNKGGSIRKGKSIARTLILDSFERLGRSETEFIDQVVLAAICGDDESTRFVLEKLLPKARPVQDPIQFDIKGESLIEKAECILHGVSKSELSVDQASTLINALGTLNHLIEVDQILKRLEALEEEPRTIEGQIIDE